MKHILFLLLISPSLAWAKTITIEIPDQDIAIIESIVPDTEEWIQNAVDGKLNACRKRIIKREIGLSVKKKETLPAGEDAIIQKYLNRPDGDKRGFRDQR